MEDEALAADIAGRLGGRRIATAESCTAGRIASTLASVPGAAEFLRGGLVAYQEEIKRTLLGVTAESCLTLQAAEEMAAGACRLLGADVSVATTGVAGDEPEDGVPPGTVFVATCVGRRVHSRRHHFEGDPEQVCDRARHRALLDLRDALID